MTAAIPCLGAAYAVTETFSFLKYSEEQVGVNSTRVVL